MVPFTRNFKFDIETQTDKDVVMTTQTFQHESLKINFKKNYLGAVNFYAGFQRALTDAEVYEHNRRFDSFSRRRKNCWALPYNDGIGYFSDMCD